MSRQQLRITTLLIALLGIALLNGTGCHSDPHDTHIETPIGIAR